MSKLPWYNEGLNFKCTGCGQCCTGAPGYVWITDDDIKKIAAHLNLTIEDFKGQYVRNVDGLKSLIEKSNFDCIFLKENKCTIYHLRPAQCRTYPWWPGILESKERWLQTARHCEGIDPNAPKVPFEEIETNRKIYEQDRFSSDLSLT